MRFEGEGIRAGRANSVHGSRLPLEAGAADVIGALRSRGRISHCHGALSSHVSVAAYSSRPIPLSHQSSCQLRSMVLSLVPDASAMGIPPRL